MKYIISLLLVVLALSTGCNDHSKPDTRKLAEAIEEQKNNDWGGDTVEHRKEVRQAIINHATKYFPECNIQGITIDYRLGNYRVGVDCISGDKRQTLTFRVDLFITDNGEMYWKTEYIPLEPNARPFDYVTELYTLTKEE